jgi:hypothetical protein
MMAGVCTGLAARLPISTRASRIPVGAARDWANEVGVNLTCGSRTQTISTAPPSSVFPGTAHRWQHSASKSPRLCYCLVLWQFFKMKKEMKLLSTTPEDVWESEGTAPYVLNLRNRWTPGPFYPQGKSPRYLLVRGGWAGPSPGLDAPEKGKISCPYRVLNLISLVIQPVA